MKKQKIRLAIQKTFVYNNTRCDMIAMKREIAGAGDSMFRVTPWSECLGRLQDLVGTPNNLTTSHCTEDQSAQRRNDVISVLSTVRRWPFF